MTSPEAPVNPETSIVKIPLSSLSYLSVVAAPLKNPAFPAVVSAVAEPPAASLNVSKRALALSCVVISSQEVFAPPLPASGLNVLLP